MRSRLLHSLLGLAALFLAIASCSPAGPTPQAGGGIGGTGSVATVSSGPVTKFGSVFVSGTEYDNTNTLYCIDDTPCTETNTLKLGMVVLVNGMATEDYATNQLGIRVANTITYEETVEGEVQSVAADGLSLIVLGQVVHIDQNTNIDASIPGKSIANLVPGTDVVEVSGFIVGDGHILATFIELQTGTPHYEILGVIKNHEPAKLRFDVGTLMVEYTTTTDTSQMPPLSQSAPTWNGIVVHVRGDQWSSGGPGPSGAKLTATRTKPQTLGVTNIEDAEVEGFITHLDPSGTVFIDNIRITTTPSTVFEGGTALDLILDTRIEVHGRVVNGVLEAEHVSFKGAFELESNVASINPGARSLTLVGISGTTLYADNETAIDGEGNLRRFADIAVGDHLKIHGRPAGNTGILITELERSDPGSKVKLQGPIQSVLDPTLTIAGARINASGILNNRFIGTDGTIIGRSGFFQGLGIGRKVTITGTAAGDTVTWTSARISAGD
ncbi:MAG: hypothetical protein CAF44_005080 [Nitrospira sp. CG24D]|nr:MAG: hypothetical protein CAF44_005080 [Nitrospira sp. CG24D]